MLGFFFSADANILHKPWEEVNGGRSCAGFQPLGVLPTHLALFSTRPTQRSLCAALCVHACCILWFYRGPESVWSTNRSSLDCFQIGGQIKLLFPQQSQICCFLTSLTPKPLRRLCWDAPCSAGPLFSSDNLSILSPQTTSVRSSKMAVSRSPGWLVREGRSGRWRLSGSSAPSTMVAAVE